MKLEIREDSTNYTAQVVKLPTLQPVTGLDNLVRVNIFGNDCLIGKDTDINELHVFFPSECQLSAEYLKTNGLYRHSELNADPEKKGFFEDNGRVKAIKFRGIISSGFVIPVKSLAYVGIEEFKVGMEFNNINGYEICKKYTRRFNSRTNQPVERLLDKLVDAKLAPEHPDTAQLMRNLDKVNLDDYVAITYKLHGTSARYYNTLTKRSLSWIEKLARFFGAKIQTEDYNYVSASRRVVKSLNFEALDGKRHYYDYDLWTEVGRNHFKDKLIKSEAVYCEIVGADYSGKAIQHGYSYGLQVPKVFVYRISHISPQGIEVDLPYSQMKERAEQLGVQVCPEYFYGKVSDFVNNHGSWNIEFNRDLGEALTKIFYEQLLEQPSVLDPSVTEEGFCLRIEKYPKPEFLKIKAKSFLLSESKNLDNEAVVDIEEEQA